MIRAAARRAWRVTVAFIAFAALAACTAPAPKREALAATAARPRPPTRSPPRASPACARTSATPGGR